MTQQDDNFTIALIGGGNMGGAMLGGWLAQGVAPARITVVDPSPPEAAAAMMAAAGVTHARSAQGLAPTDVLALAVKPQIMGAVLPSVKALAGPDTVAVSVAAGITIDALEAALGCAVVRSMPNTPALVRRGVTVGCASPLVTAAQRERVHALLQAVGRVEWVEDEALIDAVTAVSGSGPAYVFHLAECMAAAGEAAGLPPELAMILACETVSGAGELLAQSPDGPAKLRQNVTSPNGTTAAALAVLMAQDGMPDLLKRAVAAAKRRSRELSGS